MLEVEQRSSGRSTVRLWSVATAQLVYTMIGHTACVWSVAFSSTARCIASASRDMTIRIWDVETGDSLAEPLRGHTDNIWSVAFSRDGKCVVSGSSDKSIRFWGIL